MESAGANPVRSNSYKLLMTIGPDGRESDERFTAALQSLSMSAGKDGEMKKEPCAK